MTYFIDTATGRIYAASHSADTGEIDTWDEITEKGWQTADRLPAYRFERHMMYPVMQIHPNAVEALRPGLTLSA